MDVERRLISRTVLGGHVETLVARGIAASNFARLPTGEESEHAAVFRTLVSHMRQYNAPPSRDAVLAAHPGYRLEPAEDPLDYLIDRFIEQVKRRAVIVALDDAIKRIDDPSTGTDADMLLFEAAESVVSSTPSSSRISKLSDAPSRRDQYLYYLREGRPRGIALGYPTLDRIILGVQDYEVVTVAAPSAWGKSTQLQFISLTTYLDDVSQRPLFISLEMEADALLRRFDAMAMKVRANAIKGFEIAEDDDDMRRWEQWAERASRAPNDLLIQDNIFHPTVDRIHAEILRYKPTSVFVDYVQLMEGPGDNSYLRVGAAIKGLKRIARQTKIPVFTAAQTNRSGFKDGVTEDNIADSIEIFRSSDILLGLERTDELDAKNQAILKIVKNRDAPKGHCTTNFNWEMMDFSEHTGFERRTNGARSPAPPDDVPSSAIPAPAFVDNPFAIAAMAA